MCFITLFVEFILGGLIALIKVLAKLSSIGFPSVGVFPDCKTGCMGQRYWQTPVLTIYSWQLFQLLLLICINRVEEIKF